MAGAVRYDPIVAEDLALGVGGFTVSNPGGADMVGSRINLSNFAILASQTWAPAAVAASNVGTVDVPCLGARIGYPVLVSFTGILGHQNHSIHGEVVVDDNVRVFLVNNDAFSTLTVGSGTLRVYAFPVPLT